MKSMEAGCKAVGAVEGRDLMPETLPPPAPTVRPPWWHWINWLALDAVAVALVWLPIFGHVTGARLRPVNYIVLGAAVWMVYMADRLLDGRSGRGTAGRHSFARRGVKGLLPVMALVAGAAVWLACRDMRWITVMAGLWIGWAVVIYFVVVAASWWKPVSSMLLMGMSTLMVMGLVQAEGHGALGIQLWRAMAAGTLLTVLYFGLKGQYNPPPWTLVKKGMGGYLFALGVAVAPYSHVQDWEGLLKGAPVILFAGACTLNSLGIRLWEGGERKSDAESVLLRRIYPWLLAAVGLGALVQGWEADAWSRAALLGVAACAAGFGVMHLRRNRWPRALYAVVADTWMVAVGAGVLLAVAGRNG